MKLVFAKEMQSLDQQSAEQIGLPTMVLMENAGKAVAETAADFLEDCFVNLTGATQFQSSSPIRFALIPITFMLLIWII